MKIVKLLLEINASLLFIKSAFYIFLSSYKLFDPAYEEAVKTRTPSSVVIFFEINFTWLQLLLVPSRPVASTLTTIFDSCKNLKRHIWILKQRLLNLTPLPF